MKIAFDWKKFLRINCGVLIMCLGIYFYLFPNNIVTGGVSGFALALQYFFPNFPISIMVAMMNLVLFVVAFIFIGPEFGGYTVYAGFATSGYLWILEKLFPLAQPIVEDFFLNVLFGTVISGIGMGIIFHQNASTGGTDILGKLLSMGIKMNIGISVFVVDFLVVLLGGLVYGIERGMFAVLGAFLQAFTIDYFIAGLHKKVQVSIYSTHYEKINQYIHHDLLRGSTLYQAVGGYSLNNKIVIYTVLSKKEFLKLKEFIQGVDQDAFVTVHYISEAIGEGFTYDSFGHFSLPKR